MITHEVLERFLDGARGQALREGTRYAGQNRVGELLGSRERISTVVRGRSGDFEVALWSGGAGIEHRCSCSSWRDPCKHEVAAALVLRGRLAGGSRAAGRRAARGGARRPAGGGAPRGRGAGSQHPSTGTQQIIGRRWHRQPRAERPGESRPLERKHQQLRVHVSDADPREIGRALLAEYGFAADQFSCLDALYGSESDWRVAAGKPAGSAYGNPPALPALPDPPGAERDEHRHQVFVGRVIVGGVRCEFAVVHAIVGGAGLDPLVHPFGERPDPWHRGRVRRHQGVDIDAFAVKMGLQRRDNALELARVAQGRHLTQAQQGAEPDPAAVTHRLHQRQAQVLVGLVAPQPLNPPDSELASRVHWIGRSVRPAQSLAGDRCADLATLHR